VNRKGDTVLALASMYKYLFIHSFERYTIGMIIIRYAYRREKEKMNKKKFCVVERLQFDCILITKLQYFLT